MTGEQWLPEETAGGEYEKTYAHTYTLGTPSKYRAKYQTNSKLQAAQASGSVSIGKSPPDQSR